MRLVKQLRVYWQIDPELMELVDELLNDFVEQGRMKLPGSTYQPCYRVEK